MWIILSVGAAVFWGLTYVFNEQVYKKVSVPFSLALSSLIVFIITFTISIVSNNIEKDINTVSSSKELFINIILGILTLLIAELFIGYSIIAKNATLAGLIEISYPLFIALFSFIIYKESTLSVSVIVGGVVIIIGIVIIYLAN